jgi:hypothetical protein
MPLCIRNAVPNPTGGPSPAVPTWLETRPKSGRASLPSIPSKARATEDSMVEEKGMKEMLEAWKGLPYRTNPNDHG